MAQQMMMSKIQSCDVKDCAYNKHNACHTPAITVGGPGDACAECDTYFNAAQPGGVLDLNGGVGACKMSNCEYNDSLECNAQTIQVVKHDMHAECKTFEPR
jgi:hypothetical protein